MPIDTLNAEDHQRLDEHFWAILRRACLRNKCWPGEVLNGKRKPRHVAQARAEIAKEVRETAFTSYDCNGECRLWLVDETVRAFPAKVNPVSFPLLGKMLGLHHATLVYALQRLKKQEQSDASEAV